MLIPSTLKGGERGSMVIDPKDRRSQRWSEDGYEESNLALAHFPDCIL